MMIDRIRPLAMAAFAALILAGCAPVEAGGETPPPSRGPRAEGQMCGGIAGFACAEGLYCQMSPNMRRVADAAGKCVKQPQVCTREYRPVCGFDDKTYGNACTAAAAGVSVAYPGECKKA